MNEASERREKEREKQREEHRGEETRTKRHLHSYNIFEHKLKRSIPCRQDMFGDLWESLTADVALHVAGLITMTKAPPRL